MKTVDNKNIKKYKTIRTERGTTKVVQNSVYVPGDACVKSGTIKDFSILL